MASEQAVARFAYGMEYATTMRPETLRLARPQRAETRVVAVDYPS